MSIGQVSGIDPEMLRYAAWLSVWVRWFVWVATATVLVYRPDSWFPDYWSYLLLHPPLVVFNGLLHYWLLSKRPVTWVWLLSLSAMDIALLTGSIVIGGDFRTFFHLGYYPALALVAAVLPILRFSLVWTTMVAVLYTVVSATQGSGLDLDRLDDKVLIARVAAMYAVVAIVVLIVRFERLRWRESMERERELHRERVEVSRTIHDTVAQTAYMVGLGLQRARELGGESNEDLAATLQATAELQRSAIWELRYSLDGGQVYEGVSLRGILRSHAATFTTVTSVPAEVVVRGVEPELATEVRSRLFSIAHNALTNAFRHARAGRVEVGLDFTPDSVRLSVSDDGVGLPDDHDQRGHGFASMRADAGAIGGRLTVETDGRRGGTTVTCTVPL